MFEREDYDFDVPYGMNKFQMLSLLGILRMRIKKEEGVRTIHNFTQL
jgi:hypothetical protein